MGEGRGEIVSTRGIGGLYTGLGFKAVHLGGSGALMAAFIPFFAFIPFIPFPLIAFIPFIPFPFIAFIPSSAALRIAFAMLSEGGGTRVAACRALLCARLHASFLSQWRLAGFPNNVRV